MRNNILVDYTHSIFSQVYIYEKLEFSDDIDYIILSRDLTLKILEFMEEYHRSSQDLQWDIYEYQIDKINDVLEDLSKNKHCKDLFTKYKVFSKEESL